MATSKVRVATKEIGGGHNSNNNNKNQKVSTLAVPMNDDEDDPYGCCEYTNYIAASYVKWLEAAGARSIHIPYDETDTERLDELFSQINGILLPGGDSDFPFSAAYLLNRSIDANMNTEEHDFFPVWGTCLGFEFMVEHIGSARGTNQERGQVIQQGFAADNVTLPLLSVDPVGLYQDPIVNNIVTHYNVTMNNHDRGIEPSRFMENKLLSEAWKITSTNFDLMGRAFVSTIEPRDPDRFPFYGVQFHPEKNAFEYGMYPGTNIPYEVVDHSDNAVYFSIYMARFFVNLARKNNHYFTDPNKFTFLTDYPVTKESYLGFEQIFILPSASSTTDANVNKEATTAVADDVRTVKSVSKLALFAVIGVNLLAIVTSVLYRQRLRVRKDGWQELV